MKSVLQNECECFICGRMSGLHRHHCLHGTSNRKNAEQYGLWVYLCAAHHADVHAHSKLDLKFKQMAQEHFEQNIGTRQDFIRIFGKSWI